MQLSENTLKRMRKDDLISIILDLQNSSDVDLFGDTKLFFKRNFQNYSGYANGNKKYGFIVTGKNKTLYISWNKYVPSGYGDNGIGGSFEISLTNKQLKSIRDKGFTKSVIMPIIKDTCENVTGFSRETTELIAD